MQTASESILQHQKKKKKKKKIFPFWGEALRRRRKKIPNFRVFSPPPPQKKKKKKKIRNPDGCIVIPIRNYYISSFAQPIKTKTTVFSTSVYMLRIFCYRYIETFNIHLKANRTISKPVSIGFAQRKGTEKKTKSYILMCLTIRYCSLKKKFFRD